MMHIEFVKSGDWYFTKTRHIRDGGAGKIETLEWEIKNI